jgi:hypothetical protein
MTRLPTEAEGWSFALVCAPRWEVRVTVLLLLIFSILPLSSNALYSSTTASEDPSFAGVWKGDSVCQIKDSPCHDEASVYYVSKNTEPNSFQMKMNKMVDGKEVTMGTVSCKACSNSGSYVCRLNDFSTWTWRLNKNVLDGDLQYRGQLYRKIHLIRAE